MSDLPPLSLARVAAADVRPLRSAVLRPGVPPEALVYDGDDAPGAVHFAARDAEGNVHGIASLCPEAAPGRSSEVVAWRLRGMATTPALRGAGIGRQLLRVCFRHIRGDGGGLLWCNARVVAIGFYERLGLDREGEPFDIPGIGAHYVMSRWLAHLRLARVEEAPALSALAMRYAPELAVTEAQLRGGTHHFVAATVQGQLAGFHAIEPQANGEVLLDALVVEPGWIGRGIGRELFENAVSLAAKLGASRLVALTTPEAAGFYARMGARADGEASSPLAAHRRLPRYVLELC